MLRNFDVEVCNLRGLYTTQEVGIAPIRVLLIVLSKQNRRVHGKEIDFDPVLAYRTRRTNIAKTQEPPTIEKNIYAANHMAICIHASFLLLCVHFEEKLQYSYRMNALV